MVDECRDQLSYTGLGLFIYIYIKKITMGMSV